MKSAINKMNSERGDIMLDFIELEQLVAFADYGTLSKAAQELHISQPTLTRNMKHIEEAFGVCLFNRTKNKIELNKTGLKAVEYARKLIFEAENSINAVQSYDRSLRVINVASCAPAPLWYFLPTLTAKYSQNTISSKLMDIDEIIEGVSEGIFDIGIIPYKCPKEELFDLIYMTERLSVCVPYSNSLAQRDKVRFEELNGFNCLLRDKIGFWTDLCYEKMPASRFLVQTKEFEFQELVKNSTLLCFTTNLARLDGDILRNRKIIPIEDVEVTYHLICNRKKKDILA